MVDRYGYGGRAEVKCALVVLLHGVGATGRDLVGLGRSWRAVLPRVAVACPDAPYPFDYGQPGRQWFSLADITAEDRANRVRAARSGFDRVVADVAAERGFADRPDRVALLGFSQGAVMALDALASGRAPWAGVVSVSGRLATGGTTPIPRRPVLLLHGTADPVIPAAESERAAATLAGLGADVRLSLLPGAGHAVTAEGAMLAGAFLAMILDQEGRK